MYAQHFGLKHEPFSIAPDPRYLYMSERHREALAHLLYGVGGGGGFVLLTGEIGAGKTTVCRCFLEQVPRRCNVAYIFNPKLTVIELLKTICDEFRIPCPAGGSGQATVKDYLDPLNEYLLRTHSVGQNNVLIIDEAQNLSAEVLEQLRLLTNLETSERKLLQIILIGQPELRQMLARPELEQLAQRVIARFHLQALDEEETARYIEHRVRVAGLRRGRLFDSEAVRRIHALTAGVPRRINLLCDRALLGAYAEGRPRVGRRVVEKAAQEVFGLPLPADAQGPRRGLVAWWPRLRARPVWIGAAAVGGGLLVLAALSGLGRGPWADPAGAQRPGSALPEDVAAADPATAPAADAAFADVATRGVAPGGLRTSVTLASMSKPAAALQPMPLRAPLPITPAQLRNPEAAGSGRAAERRAWRELGALWGADLGRAAAGAGGAGDPDPCEAAQRQQLQCFRTQATLELIRTLARPGVVRLLGADGQPVHALLTGLGPQQAQIQLAGQPYTMSLDALARVWRGDFATLWRVPPGWRGPVAAGQSGPAVDWLAARLATASGAAAPEAGGRFDDALTQQLYAFQLRHGLKPDGVAGPTSFMLINRAAGLAEPRLQVL